MYDSTRSPAKSRRCYRTTSTDESSNIYTNSITRCNTRRSGRLFQLLLPSLILSLVCSTVSHAANTNVTLPSALEWGRFDDRSAGIRYCGRALDTQELPRVEDRPGQLREPADWTGGGFRDRTRADSLHAYDALQYDVGLYIRHDEGTLEGSVVMHFAVLADTLDELDLHLRDFDIGTVEVDGIEMPHEREQDLLLVDLAGHEPAAGDTSFLEIDYWGVPPTDNGLGMFISGNMAYTSSDPWGTRNWIACYDEPFDKALWNLSARVDDAYSVLANGLLDHVEGHDDGTHTWHYEHDFPMSSYLVSVVAGDLAVLEESWQDLDFTWMVYPSHVDEAQLCFSRVGQMFDCFTGYWGDYPFETYSMGEAGIYGGLGAMEHQTCSTIGHAIVAGGLAYESVIAHELSHMWWGDALTPVDFRHVWLNEGWATYAEALYYQHLAGGDWQAFLEYLDAIQQYYLSWDIEYLPIYDPPLSQLFNVSQYEKGASVIHMLRYLLGDAQFEAAQLQWYEDFAYGTVDTWDYQTVMEEASGLDLEWFFEQWIFSGGYPEYEVLTEFSDGPDSCTVHLSVNQSHQVLDAFAMPVPLRVLSSETVLETEILVDQPSGHWSWDLPGAFEELEFNRDRWILCRQESVDPPGPTDLRVVAWSVDDSEGGDGNGNLAAGESGGLGLVLRNEGGWARNLSVTPSSLDPHLELSGTWPIVEEVSWMEELELPLGYVQIEADAETELGWAELQLEIGCEPYGDWTQPFRIRVGDPAILLVNDDPETDYSSFFRADLDSLGAFHDPANAAGGPPWELLEDYRLLIWFTGDADSAVDAVDAEFIEAFRAAGDGVLVTGQDALDGLSPGDLENTYHVQLSQEDTGGIAVEGLAGTVFEPLSGLLIGSGGAANQESPSSFIPMDDCTALMNYQNSDEAAVLHAEFDEGGNTLIFGFGMEALSGLGGTSSREEFFDYCLGLLDPFWTGLSPETPGDPRFGEHDMTRPLDFGLLDVYPNPFNPVIRIRFALPRPGDLRLAVYDVLGRRTALLLEGPLHAGVHEVAWHAESLASGVYILRLEGLGRMDCRKLFLVK